MEKEGAKCNCGNNGCIEAYCAMKVLKEKIIKRKNLKDVDGKDIYNIVKNDWKSVEDIVGEYLKDLSIALSNYINIFQPEVICIGGSFVYYKDILLNKLTRRLQEDNLIFFEEFPKIITAKYNNDAGIVGATIKK